jgi:hypothetical protein
MTRIAALTGAQEINIPPEIPILVLSAFTTELYFKCLFSIKKGSNPPWEHKLKELFEFLAPEDQKRIRDIYQIAIQEAARSPSFVQYMLTLTGDPHFFDFDPILEKASKMFETWRYYYEYAPGTLEGASTGRIRGAARQVILEIKPEWQVLATVLGTPPTFPTH